jgi:hypothetical protein
MVYVAIHGKILGYDYQGNYVLDKPKVTPIFESRSYANVHSVQTLFLR